MDRHTIVPPTMRHIVERFHYAPAVRIGPWIYCAGQVGRDANMRVIEGLEAQIVQAFENVRAVLSEAGAGFEHVYAMTTYHVDIHAQLEPFIVIKDRYVLRQNPPPTWTGLGVAALSFPGQVVEIQVNAYLPG
ncbi:MAG: RidA family protein [Gammaproteobacteria bacterium]|nr:RidA family protein [Gammaproteobacteria bacterium]